LCIAVFTLACAVTVVTAAPLPQALSDDDFRSWDAAKAQLGQLLFYDKILSGNRNIACSTCHHPKHASSDGLSLGIGEGGTGLGPDRDFGTGPQAANRRVPRNALSLFNLGAKEFTVMFHDGRLVIDPDRPGGFNSPADEYLPTDLNSIIAAQALFPLISTVEMAGDASENEVAGASRRSPLYSWRILAERVANLDGYWPLFQAAWPELERSSDINISHIANAIDDFINAEWRADNSAFDRYLRGDRTALDSQAIAGMQLFYGEAGCSGCHAGALQTDHQFHALGIPPFGPGRTRLFDPIARDQGRINESDIAADAYRFRTPSLRNVTDTGPWAHNGAYSTLEAVIKHHLQPKASLQNYDRQQLQMRYNSTFTEARDFVQWQDKREMQRFSQHLDIKPQRLSKQQISELIAFLHALRDAKSIKGTYGVPDSVPSHLSVDR